MKIRLNINNIEHNYKTHLETSPFWKMDAISQNNEKPQNWSVVHKTIFQLNFSVYIRDTLKS